MNSSSHMHFPATPDWFSTIRKLLITSAVQCGFDDRTAGQIAMAVDEAMCNIHRHGYEGRSDGSIELLLTTQSSPAPKIELELIDEGKQVQIESIRSRDLEDVRPGGIGVHLIKTIMDEVIWSHNEGGGMKLLMTKEYHLEEPPSSVHKEESNV